MYNSWDVLSIMMYRVSVYYLVVFVDGLVHADGFYHNE